MLEAISKVKINESKVIGKYRNMDLEVSYNFFTNEHNFSLNGAAKHSGELERVRTVILQGLIMLLRKCLRN